MSNENSESKVYNEYDDNTKGVIEISTLKGKRVLTTVRLKEDLMHMDLISNFRRLGKSDKWIIKKMKYMKELIEITSGKIEILSHKPN